MVMTTAERLIAYFAANPDDYLTSADAVVKFGLSHRSAVWRAGMQLSERGVLSMARGEAGPYGKTPDIYSAGPEILKLIGRSE